MYVKILGTILVAGTLSCVSEATRELNLQNYQAGNLIASQTEDAVVKQVATDIVLNSGEIGLDIGLPKSNVDYTAENSARIREEAIAAREQTAGWLTLATNAVGSAFPWASGALGIGLSIFAFLKKSFANRKLRAVYDGVEKVVAHVKGIPRTDYKETKSVSADDIVDILRTTATAHNLYLDIKKDLQELRKK